LPDDVRSERQPTLREEKMEDVRDIDGCAEAEARRLLATAFETAPAGDGFAGRGLAGAELLRGVRRRMSRRRRARALVPAGAVAALGGAAAVAVTLTATVASAPSAFAAVTAAAVKTSAESFRVTATSFPAPRARDGNGSAWSSKATGQFAPSRRVGEEIFRASGWKYQLVFIGDQVYLHWTIPNFPEKPKPWVEGRLWPLSVSESAVSPQFEARWSADPGALLGLLKSAGTVTDEGPASGPGWTGTKYGFTVATPKGDRTETGTVYVDSHGLVRRMLSTFTFADLGGPAARFPEDVTVRYYTAPVWVTAPPASQVQRTTGYIFLPAPAPLPRRPPKR
jgi:hypothetical protein